MPLQLDAHPERRPFLAGTEAPENQRRARCERSTFGHAARRLGRLEVTHDPDPLLGNAQRFEARGVRLGLRQGEDALAKERPARDPEGPKARRRALRDGSAHEGHRRRAAPRLHQHVRPDLGLDDVDPSGPGVVQDRADDAGQVMRGDAGSDAVPELSSRAFQSGPCPRCEKDGRPLAAREELLDPGPRHSDLAHRGGVHPDRARRAVGFRPGAAEPGAPDPVHRTEPPQERCHGRAEDGGRRPVRREADRHLGRLSRRTPPRWPGVARR